MSDEKIELGSDTQVFKAILDGSGNPGGSGQVLASSGDGVYWTDQTGGGAGPAGPTGPTGPTGATGYTG